MKVKLVETYVREVDIDILDTDSVVEAFRQANEFAGAAEIPGTKCVGKTVLEIQTDEGGTLLVQRDGNLLLTPAGHRVFTDVASKPTIDEPVPATLRTGEPTDD